MTDSSIKLEVSKEAQDQVRGLIKSQKAGTAVRVFVQSGGGGGCGSGGCGSGGEGGGCGCGSGGGHGGPAFAMAFDQVRNGDQVISVDGFKIVVDDLSAEYPQRRTDRLRHRAQRFRVQDHQPHRPLGRPERPRGERGRLWLRLGRLRLRIDAPVGPFQPFPRSPTSRE